MSRSSLPLIWWTRLLASLACTATIWGSVTASAAEPDAARANNGPLAAQDDKRANAPIFADFIAWAHKYLAVSAPATKAALEKARLEKAALEQEGVALAAQRRKALAQLIVADPKRALELAVPLQVRRQLPSAVTQHLEERINGRGEYMVLIFDFIDPGTGARTSRIERSVTLGGKTYDAHVYGRRRGLTSKVSIPLHGIAIERLLAVHESPVRLLEPGESPDPNAPVGNPDRQCPICKAAGAHIPVNVGGMIYYFDDADHLRKFVAAIEAKEAVVDPHSSGP